MALRTLVSVWDDDGRHVQALVQSMPRSFKMHVWANYLVTGDESTTGLDYIGTIQPTDPTDINELEILVEDAWQKYQKKSNTEQK